jgi:hypothetical protein
MSTGTVAAPPKAEEEKLEDLPWFARVVNHILTPGSALTKDVWLAFNLIVAGTFMCWLIFLVLMPDSIHVWIFGALCVGLAISTNWFMKEVFAAKEDFESQKAREKEEAAAKALAEGSSTPPAEEDKKNK